MINLDLINNLYIFIFVILSFYFLIYNILKTYFSKEKEYIILIESEHKKKVYSKKPMSYENALKSITNLEHQLRCQNTYGFKKFYNIYILQYEKIEDKIIGY